MLAQLTTKKATDEAANAANAVVGDITEDLLEGWKPQESLNVNIASSWVCEPNEHLTLIAEVKLDGTTTGTVRGKSPQVGGEIKLGGTGGLRDILTRLTTFSDMLTKIAIPSLRRANVVSIC